MMFQKLKLTAAVLTAVAGVAVASAVVVRAQPSAPANETAKEPAAPKGAPEKLIGETVPQDKGTPAPQGRKDEVPKKVWDLQKERIAALRELVDVTAALFKNARDA